MFTSVMWVFGNPFMYRSDYYAVWVESYPQDYLLRVDTHSHPRVTRGRTRTYASTSDGGGKP
jgi:hypothetical protein